MTSSKALFAASVAAALLSASAGFSATIVNGGFEQDAGAAQDGAAADAMAIGSDVLVHESAPTRR